MVGMKTLKQQTWILIAGLALALGGVSVTAQSVTAPEPLSVRRAEAGNR